MLKTNFENSQRILEGLTKQKETTEIQLGRAETLVVGLADEAKRWSETVKVLQVDEINLVGNMILAAGYVSYVGPFTSKYRNILLKRIQFTSMEDTKRYSCTIFRRLKIVVLRVQQCCYPVLLLSC